MLLLLPLAFLFIHLVLYLLLLNLKFRLLRGCCRTPPWRFYRRRCDRIFSWERALRGPSHGCSI